MVSAVHGQSSRALAGLNQGGETSMKPKRLFLTLALLALAVGVATAEEGWHAFLKDNSGGQTPIENPPQKMKDKNWLTVGYSGYEGFKPRLGVVFSQEKTPQAQQYNNEWARLLSGIYGKPGQETDPFNHIEDLVRQALGATNRFTMLERTTASADVIGEQDAGASGRIDKKTAAQIGQMKGADFIVKATIIELNPEKESRDIKAIGGVMGSSALGIGSIGISGKVAFCRLNVRIIDATTGVIAYDMTVDGTASGSGLNVGGGMLGGIGGRIAGGAIGLNKKKMPAIADAMQSCANKVAFFVTAKLEDQPWQGSVAAITGSKVMINAGANIGLTSGLTLTLLSKGEAISDPDDSTSVLGYDSHQIGTLKIVDVQPKFATCDIVDGGQGVKKGDLVRLEPKKR